MDIWEEKKDILSLLPEELEAEFVAMGEQKFRAGQVFQWLSRGVRDFDEMSNLSKSLRGKLKERYFLYAPKVLSKQVSAIDGTIKYLWELRDGNAVETVVMSYKHGNTVCVSSQVGCRQGCAFCASTIGGLVRGLQASEILDEVLFSELDSGKKISNIVLMGIGEPLDNYDNVMRFLRLVNHPKGLNIGMRHISLSSCGLIERFDDLAGEDLQLTLSVSLHAPDDETRSRIMPANHGRGVEKLIEACRRYYEKTGRRISFEYAMIDGVNDSPAQARLLAKHARAVAAHVNLIPLNHVEEREFQPSTPEHMKNFIQILEDAGVNVTVRRRLGSDVDASCGQLRRKMQAQNKGKGGSAEA
jgi:23S rRNA (adenine2503-C2)-methyltransferase